MNNSVNILVMNKILALLPRYSQEPHKVSTWEVEEAAAELSGPDRRQMHELAVEVKKAAQLGWVVAELGRPFKPASGLPEESDLATLVQLAYALGWHGKRGRMLNKSGGDCAVNDGGDQ